MKNRGKLIILLSIILTMSSCGIVRFRNAPAYYAGSPYKKGYQQKGIVEEIIYDCSVPGPTQRRMIVYLPHDYYQNSRRYPVFYLLHGARGYETSWIRKGRLYESTDSLFATDLAVPCIVVMPNVNQYNDDEDFENSRFKDAFESIFEVDGTVESAFVRDVVKRVDSLYRTIPDKEHRAIAGLSIGGYQSIYFGANYPDMFGYIGAFSPYMWSIGKATPYRREFYGNLHKRMKLQYGNNPPEGYYLYAGKWDIMRPSTLKLHYYMTRKGYPHEYFRYPGSHDWKNGWIEEYQDMLQRVFKPAK